MIEIIEEFEINAKHRDIDLTIIERRRKGVSNQIKEVQHALSNNLLPTNGKTVSI